MTSIPKACLNILFQFPSGILFPDVIEVNFTLTVDPYRRRKPGLEEYVNTVQAREHQTYIANINKLDIIFLPQ